MKKIFLLLLITSVIILCGCKPNEHIDTRTYEDFKHVNDVTDIIENKKSIVLYMYDSNCPYCEEIKSNVFNYFEKHKSYRMMIRTDEIKDQINDMLLELGFDYAWVPSILIFKDGVLREFIDGKTPILDYIRNN